MTASNQLAAYQPPCAPCALSRAVRAALALSAVAGMSLASTALAANFSVTNLLDDGSAGSLRSAIVQANSLPDADTISFQTGLSGTIALNPTYGSLHISAPLTINGPGANALTINGAALVTNASTVTTSTAAAVAVSGSVFLIAGAQQAQLSKPSAAQPAASLAGLPVTLSGLTITGGSGYAYSSSGTVGGGVASMGADLTISHCTITGNSALAGGGIAAIPTSTQGGSSYGRLMVTDSHIDANHATIGGGIMSATSSLTINDSTISGNIANGPIPGATGQNTGIAGGLLVKYDNNNVSINRTSISNNSAFAEAGGLAFVTSSSATLSTLTLNASSVSSNTAGVAAGGIIQGSALTTNVINSTIANNVAIGATKYAGTNNSQTVPAIAGGLAVSLSSDSAGLMPSSFNLVNSTVAGNQAYYAGGLVLQADKDSTAVTVSATNSVIGGNSTAVGPDIVGSTSPLGSNTGTNMPLVLQNSLLQSDVAAMTASGIVVTDQGGNLFATAPMLGPLGNHGGPTPTMLALAGSPLINAGGSNVSAAPYDQRGVGYPRIIGNAIDIGATEFKAVAPPIASVSVPSLGDGGKWALGGLLALVGLLLGRRKRVRT